MVVTILLYMEEETMMIDILHDYLQRTEEQYSTHTIQ